MDNVSDGRGGRRIYAVIGVGWQVTRHIGCHCPPAGTEGVECCCAGCCQGVLVGLLGHLDGFELLRCVFPGVVDDSITPGIWIQRGV